MPSSKYDAVLPRLAPLPVEDLSYQAKVNAVKGEVDYYNDPTALAKEYRRLRQEKDALDAQAYELNLRLEAFTQMLVETQEHGGGGWGQYGVADNALRLADGDTIRVQREPYGQVKDREAFRLWCIANGYESKLQLWPTIMHAIVRERLIAGDNPPEGVEAYVRTKLIFTPMKKERII